MADDSNVPQVGVPQNKRPRLDPRMKAPKQEQPSAPKFTPIPISGKTWKTRTNQQEWEYQHK